VVSPCAEAVGILVPGGKLRGEKGSFFSFGPHYIACIPRRSLSAEFEHERFVVCGDK